MTGSGLGVKLVYCCLNGARKVEGWSVDLISPTDSPSTATFDRLGWEGVGSYPNEKCLWKPHCRIHHTSRRSA